MARIAVAGSLNLDLVVRVPRIPLPGETLLGHSFQMVPGGKGANQANAAARLCVAPHEVVMIGHLGDDSFGDSLLAQRREAGVDSSGIERLPDSSSGTATILVDDLGQNSIVVTSGANAIWDEASIVRAAERLAGASIVLLQLEIPLDIVVRLAAVAHGAGAFVILDPAPAQQLPAELLAHIDLFTPNESELWCVAGRVPESKILHKRGAAGSSWDGVDVPAIEVTPVDTTAAGDTYNAALAVALLEGRPKLEAMRFASIAAGISVKRPGAQPSAPSRAEVNTLDIPVPRTDA